MAETLNVPTQREHELQAALHQELMRYRLRENQTPMQAEAFVWHIINLVCSRAVRNSGRAAGNKNELPDWPEKPYPEAPEASRRLHLYRSVIRATVRDFAAYTHDADRRAECEARRVALWLDWEGLRDADQAGDDALEWQQWHDDERGRAICVAEWAEARDRASEERRRYCRPRNPRLTGERALYDV
jgi:hypothetical protein